MRFVLEPGYLEGESRNSELQIAGLYFAGKQLARSGSYCPDELFMYEDGSFYAVKMRKVGRIFIEPWLE